MTSTKSVNADVEKTILDLSVTIKEKRFLKADAAQNGLTVSGIIQNYKK